MHLTLGLLTAALALTWCYCQLRGASGPLVWVGLVAAFIVGQSFRRFSETNSSIAIIALVVGITAEVLLIRGIIRSRRADQAHVEPGAQS